MDLIVFDLDGTLLNRSAEISDYTRDTLVQLSEVGIAYTVATGRTLHAAREILQGHGFHLPQIFKNGVMIWTPAEESFSHQNFLTLSEIQHVVEAIMSQQVTPFMFTLEPGNRHLSPRVLPLGAVALSQDVGKRHGVSQGIFR